MSIKTPLPPTSRHSPRFMHKVEFAQSAIQTRSQPGHLGQIRKLPPGIGPFLAPSCTLINANCLKHQRLLAFIRGRRGENLRLRATQFLIRRQSIGPWDRHPACRPLLRNNQDGRQKRATQVKTCQVKTCHPTNAINRQKYCGQKDEGEPDRVPPTLLAANRLVAAYWLANSTLWTADEH